MSAPAVLKLGEAITILPVVHGSGDYAVAVRRFLLDHPFDCLAVPLPRSFQQPVEEAVMELPAISMVTQAGPVEAGPASWRAGGEEDDEELPDWSYVPVDPCQAVVAAVRLAMEERVPRAFIDLETAGFEPHESMSPDPYALKRVSIEKFAVAVLPSIQPPGRRQRIDRIRAMAARLRALEGRFRSIAFVCGLQDWPWVRDAYRRQLAPGAADEAVGEAVVRRPAAGTLLFMLGELPFITALYERARAELTEDRDLTVDGVKELLLAARARYRRRSGKPARRITPKMLSIYLRYVRNLSLIERRLTPDLYTLAVAARQVAGDGFAISLVETARQYAYEGRPERPEIVLGIGRGRLDDGRCVGLVSRLPGPPVHWRTLGLRPPPPAVDRARWRMLWNPFGQVSWPAEDVAVERFRAHVFDRARAVMGADQARAEKFTTSLRDGLDIRETLRNWYAGDLYVKVLPPAVGTVDGVVMLFDTPADPRDYPWRSTWYAEHDQESTLAFYATNFLGDIVGPGIAQATYGGAMFLYPPRAIPDVWTDAHLDFADTLEERLLGAACLHTAQRNVVLLSPRAPTASWRKIARRFRRRWVHLPLSHFSASTVEQLRTFHVLNGRQVRSYAAYFIRRP